MRVPLLDLSQQYRLLADPIRAEIEEILHSQRFILGPKLREFERAITEFCRAPFAIGVSSGTDALLAILMGMGVGRGDAVITTAFTFFATAGCVVRLGAKPVFVDIDQATLNISAAALEKFLNEQCEKRDQSLMIRKTGEKIRAIIPVHLFGLCCEMNDIHRIAEQFGLTIIEDAAQAIGAEYPFLDGTRAAGTMGATGFFSFYPTKNLGAAGDAGLILCRDHNVAEKLRSIREHGMRPRYHHALVGGNFRLDEIQAAILKVKLPYLPEWSAARRAAADFYHQQFAETGLTNVIHLPAEPYRDRVTEHHVYHLYVIRTSDRDALREHLTRSEIGSEIYYPLGLHLQGCFRDLGYREGDLVETERATHEVLALPMYPEISRESQRYVVETISRFFAHQGRAAG